MTITAHPLSWPAGWKRTDPSARSYGRFSTSKTNGSNAWRSKEKITIAGAVRRLREELARMGVRDDEYELIRRHATLDTPHFFWRCHSPGSQVDAAIDAAEKRKNLQGFPKEANDQTLVVDKGRRS